MKKSKVKIIGAGLAGSETAYYLAKNGVKVELYDIKPNSFTPAHKSKNLGELVCSNSLKSNDIYGNACGLLKEEMRILGSLIIEAGDKTAVPAGGALAVNREEFSAYITNKVLSHENIKFVSKEITEIDDNDCDYLVIATGPLTTEKLFSAIKNITGNELAFFDASAPIVDFSSIDMDNAFFGDRYGRGNNDHINCPMDKETYERFITELLGAKRAELHDFEDTAVFEGCMPVEIMAGRGRDTLRFGPLKPVGLDDPKTGRWPYACLQLRREDKEGSMYNLVGFQTNLLFPEQKRVFSIIPALKNAEFLRYGVMHRNTFIKSPNCLNADFSLKSNPKIYFAGQITGVEGYVESAGSGLIVGVNILNKIKNNGVGLIPEKTVLGSLSRYIAAENKDFQPMNANFGIIPKDEVAFIRDKKQKKEKMAKISLDLVSKYKETL